jgi:hypothetical protein
MINPATGESDRVRSARVGRSDPARRNQPHPAEVAERVSRGLQDRTVTVGKTTYELKPFSFAIATMNPVELGQGTFPLSEAAADRFAIIVNVPYLPPAEEEKLVSFDFKQVRPQAADVERADHRATERDHGGGLPARVAGEYIRRLVGATRPYNAETWGAPVPVGPGRALRRPRWVTARHDLLGTAGQGLGAVDART